MAYDIENLDFEIDERFKVSDDGRAEWALVKIREAEEKRERMAEHYKKEMETINARADSTVAYMKSLLMEYFVTVPRHVTKSGIEKYKLPSGELIQKPVSIEYERDTEKLLFWCREQHPEYIKVTETPAWAEIKTFIKDTGEIPDGVIPVEAPPKFDVRVVT